MSKIFTPLEATRTLPLVRQIVRDVLKSGRELRRLTALGDPTPADEQQAHDLATSLQELFVELERIGCTFRGPNFEFGTVDFPGIIDGRPVHLCWRDGEAELLYYHDPRAGFAGRQPIPSELLVAEK
jgi:hypothetical protein